MDDEFVIKKLEELLNTPISRVDVVRGNTFGVQFENRKVVGLGLYNCNLREFPELITKLKYLQVLCLKNNQISTLPESFGNLRVLRELQLRKNQLRTIPNAFAKLQTLRKLDLKHNHVITFPTPLLKLRFLESLSLGYNRLSILPESLGYLPSLQRLKLEHNELMSLPPSLLNLHNLIRVNFDNNPLDWESKEIYRKLKDRTYLILYQLKIRSKISLELDEFIEGFYRTRQPTSWWSGKEGEYGYLVLTNQRILYYQQKTVACLNWIPLWTSFELKYSTYLKSVSEISTGGWLNKYISINGRKHFLHKVRNKPLSKKLKKLIEIARQKEG